MCFSLFQNTSLFFFPPQTSLMLLYSRGVKLTNCNLISSMMT